jgi:hypothetical protein
LLVHNPPTIVVESVEATGVVNVPTRNEVCTVCVPVETVVCAARFGTVKSVPETDDVPVGVSKNR